MTKKLRIIIALVILAFSFSVNAEVSLEIDCNNKNISKDNNVTCEGNLVYGEVYINDIDFEYQTNLNMEFLSLPGFNLSKNDNKVSIHPDTPLYDDFLDSKIVMKFTLTGNDNLEKIENLVLKNIRINKTDIIIDSISESFNVDFTKVLDNNCYLNSLTIDNISVPNFDKDVLEYKNIIANNNVVYVDAIRSSDKSSTTGLGEVFIKPGETIEHHVTVVAEDNTSRTYKLFITNNGNEITSNKKEELSNDNTLKSLEIYNGDEKIPFVYDNKKDLFNITIDKKIDKITITAILNNNKAFFVSPYGPRDVLVKLGENKVLIKIRAENNNEKVYTLNINLKDELYDNNELKSLLINNQEIDLANEKLAIIIPNNVTKTNIVAIPQNAQAIVKYEDKDLNIGDNTITIEVVSVSGISKIYEINVIREDILLGDINVLENTIVTSNCFPNIICYIVFGVGILVVIISLIYFKKKKNTIM